MTSLNLCRKKQQHTAYTFQLVKQTVQTTLHIQVNLRANYSPAVLLSLASIQLRQAVEIVFTIGHLNRFTLC